MEHRVCGRGEVGAVGTGAAAAAAQAARRRKVGRRKAQRRPVQRPLHTFCGPRSSQQQQEGQQERGQPGCWA